MKSLSHTLQFRRLLAVLDFPAPLRTALSFTLPVNPLDRLAAPFNKQFVPTLATGTPARDAPEVRHELPLERTYEPNT